MILFKTIAKNIHDTCTEIPDCVECKLYLNNKGTCPYEYMFGSMPCDWVFGGDENEMERH